uniref:non-specific serine/threonine protein kinase n=1 Tax=viral metagenome TaxID=1070528 RepID=A0A6C0I7C9_9ZZZZ
MLANKYKLLEKLSQGSFGKVFKAENIRTREIVAIKTEVKTKEQKSLKMEAKIYQYLANIDGFPQLKWFGATNNVTYLVTNLLEQSLTNIVKKYGRLSLKTVLLLGIQMVERLETLHNHYLVHRDIKPDNFMINISDKTNKIYLIDFGFCKRYNHDGNHIEFKMNKTLIGTPNYVSLNVHKGCEPSRRDDLESCLYVMIYMLFGKFFSIESQSENSNISPLKILVLKKEQLTNIPRFLTVAMNYVRTLKFEEDPDYQYIIRIFTDLLLEQKELNEESEEESTDYCEWC